MMQKISIRFFDDTEVRAVWDDEHSKWWFSVLDIVGVLRGEADYEKNRNYWKYLKTKLKKENNELVSRTTQLKLTAADGKKYRTDTLDYVGVIELAKNFPSKQANRFTQWFTYSDETIEGMPENSFGEIIDKYVEMNVAHPFMEGNGRSTRIWLDLILKKNLKQCVDWSKITKSDYLAAMTESTLSASRIKGLLQNALTDKINDREVFMKGVDYSYYYEQDDEIIT